MAPAKFKSIEPIVLDAAIMVVSEASFYGVPFSDSLLTLEELVGQISKCGEKK